MAIIHVVGSSIFFHIIFLLIFPMITTSFSESEPLLKLKASFTNSIALDSWQPGTEPCAKNKHWIGVICYKGVVSGLRLGHMGLSGKLDVDALVSLSGLRSISFVSNAFSGPIPDFHRMGALKGLYLSNNKFSGDIHSDYFLKMGGLKKIWLSGNRFSGPIPSSLSNLSRLMELHLEDNQFSGIIPPLKQPSLVSLNLSNNNLEGEIPPSMSRYKSNVFVGNHGLCGGNSGRACLQDPETPSIKASSDANDQKTEDDHKHNRFKTINAAIGVWTLVGSAVVFLLMISGIVIMKRRQDRASSMVDGSPSLSRVGSGVGKKGAFGDLGRERFELGDRVGSSVKGSKKFGKRAADIVVVNDEKGEFCLADLMKATAEVLGNGVLGSSYKAVMEKGSTVVVKRIKDMAKMGEDQFDAEIRRFGSLKHKNVLTPLGYYYRKGEKLLVYEFQPKGSLLFLLHGDRGLCHAELNWPVRFRIIQGIARGLVYLHTELSSLVLPHGNLKSSNVLLTQDNEPLLSDYGFYSLTNGSQSAQALAAYKAPEATSHHGQISPKCDTFCFGIIILEILTGKYPSHYVSNGEGGIDLIMWSRLAIEEGKEAELLDPDITTNSKKCIREMTQLLHIGVACTERDPEQRLDIREALRRTEDLAVGENDRDDDITTVEIVPSSENGFGDQCR